MRMAVHNWRTDVVTLWQVPAGFVREVSAGRMEQAIDVQVNRRQLAGYDLILSIGQVVPHEVAGQGSYYIAKPALGRGRWKRIFRKHK